MHLALTADWLPTFGGAEHVIAQFHALWPEAPIFTTVARPERLGPLATADIRTTNLQRWYRLIKRHEFLLPWMPRAVEQIDLRAYDTILSSSHAVGKGIIPRGDARHICYCHTPMRYAWEMEEQYLQDFRIPKLLRPLVRKQLAKLREWDLTTAKRVDTFIANSTTTAERIKRIYDRESVVIRPPVEERFFADTEVGNEKYYLAIGRLVPYKRFDLLIEVANRLRLPLKIAGTGSESKRLQQLAGDTVEFLGYVPSDDLPALYQGADAVLFPQLEDAGVVPLEAQASGTPVIAYGQGGALDTVQPGVTGMFFEEQTPEALESILQTFDPTQFDRAVITQHARQYAAKRFGERIRNIVEVE